MKTLKDYLDKVGDSSYEPIPTDGFPISWVSTTLAKAAAERVEEITLTDDEYRAFMIRYTDILPWDWDGKSFRGMKINRITKING